MSDILFPQDTTSVTPATGDIIMLADVSDSNNLKETTLAELPISTATQTALDNKQDILTGLTASVTELNYTDGVTSSIQTQIDGKQTTLVSGTNIKTINSTSLLGSGDIIISGAVSDGDKGDITVSGTGTTWTIDNNVVSNAKLAQVATATFKGRTTAGTGNIEDLTTTQATALLNVAVGDSGSGGTKGLVPAPASGDATKFLRGDMTYQTISGGGDALTTNPLSQFASTTSAQLAGVISDETGSGSVVFANSPTLTTPRFADLGFIADSNGNEMLAFNQNASAVNYIELENSATGSAVHIRAKGDDANVGFHLVPKGTGFVNITDSTDETKRIRFNPSGNSTGVITTLESVDTVAGTKTLPTGTTTLVGTDSTQTLTNKTLTSPTLTTPVLGTPSSGTLTNCTGLPVAGITASTTQAIGVGSVELGHASDTTISRVSAGVIAVEGVTVPTISSTDTLTNKTISGASNTLTVDGTNEVGFRIIPQNSQSAAYTLVLADSGKHIYHPSADTTARTWTIPANSSVAFPIGTAITFINDTSAGNITIAITTDTLILAGAGTTGSRTLAPNGIATATKITSTRWQISGVNLT